MPTMPRSFHQYMEALSGGKRRVEKELNKMLIAGLGPNYLGNLRLSVLDNYWWAEIGAGLRILMPDFILRRTT